MSDSANQPTVISIPREDLADIAGLNRIDSICWRIDSGRFSLFATTSTILVGAWTLYLSSSLYIPIPLLEAIVRAFAPLIPFITLIGLGIAWWTDRWCQQRYRRAVKAGMDAEDLVKVRVRTFHLLDDKTRFWKYRYVMFYALCSILSFVVFVKTYLPS